MDKTFIVAGGSSGIGYEVIKLLLNENYTVINLDKKPLENHYTGGNYIFRKVDLRSSDLINHKVRELIDEGYKFDGVAIVAGVGYTTQLKDMTPSRFISEIEANLFVTFNVCYAVIPYLSRPSSIVTIGSTSIYGFIGSSVAYSAAKAGIVGLTKSLASELGEKGIRVNCVIPGAVETDLFKSLSSATERSMMSKLTPIGNNADPIQIAKVIMFFLKGDSDHITGQTIVVDGGLSLSYRPAYS